MTIIKLYDSAINAINGKQNPKAQVGDVQNVDIQELLEMVKNGEFETAKKILNSAGIRYMSYSDNGTTILQFEFENREYTIRYNPASSDTELRYTVNGNADKNYKSMETYTWGNFNYSDITNTAEYVNPFKDISVTFKDGRTEHFSPAEYDGVKKICVYLGIEFPDPSSLPESELKNRELADTPSNRQYVSYMIASNELLNKMTPESAVYINEHPEEFNGIVAEYPPAITPGIYTRYLDYLNGDMVSSEELYDRYIAEFSSRLHDDDNVSIYRTANPAYNVKLNGDTIEFTDNTVKAIKKYLDQCYSRAEEPCNFIKILGITRKDSEETIWEKINAFCMAHGSTDGNTLSLTNYYDILAETASCDKDGTSIWPTKEQCSAILSDYIGGIEAFFNERGITLPKNQQLRGNEIDVVVPSMYQMPRSAEISTPTGGIELTEEDLQAARDVQLKSEIDNFKNNIQNFNDFKLDKNASFFDSGKLPIFAVELDDNGNVIFGDKFKDALKKYFTNLINAIKADIADYDSNLDRIRKQGLPNGTAMTQLCQSAFMGLFGLTECPMDFTEPYAKKPNMEAWMADIQSYIDNDSKMETLIAIFCKNIGSTDGKSVSVEQYYTALADNNIYETITTYGQHRVTFSNEDSIDASARIEAYLTKLKEKYPEIYDEYAAAISGEDFMYHSDGKIRGDSYVYLQGNDDPYHGTMLNDVLRLAAGITGDETYTEQRAKMKALFEAMGASPDDPNLEVDDIKVINYLLGDNANKINYFALLTQKRTEKENGVAETKLEIGTPDSNIKVTRGRTYTFDDVKTITEQNALTAEITSYLENLLAPIYEKYYAVSGNHYENLEIDNPDWSNPDSGDYGHITYIWKDDAVKEACAKEIEEAIKQLLAEYSDVLTSVIYDGQRVLFTTIYDDENPNNPYSPINQAGLSGTTALNGLAHAVSLVPTKSNPLLMKNPTDMEPTIDTPKIYTPTPKVIENNIPENAPVGVKGENLVKTAWDGIWISEDCSYIYLWDSKNQQYIAMENYTTGANGGSFAQSLANGYLDGLPVNDSSQGGYEIDNILLSLVYGYNRTESPYIFEKDGKYYAYDAGVQSHNGYTGLEQLNDMLREITVTTTAPARAGTVGEESAEKTDDGNNGAGTTPPSTGGNGVGVNTNQSTDNNDDDYYANLDKKIATIAAELGFEKNDDGNYYYCEGNNTYICVWNPWTEKFDKCLIATEDSDNVELEPNEDGGFNASTPTLDSYLAESLITAKEEGFVPTEDTGVFTRDNERYVYDITTHTFIKETDAAQNKTKTWAQAYLEACKLARTLGYKPSSIAFCIFEDSEGNKFKYDTKEEKFVEYKY